MKSERREYGKVLVFAVLFATLALGVSVGCASGTTHYVNPGESIQAAVDAADPGDTIIVRDGIYSENINVDEQLTIQSENGSENCIIQAANSNYPVFAITADCVNIKGFTVEGATGSTGIRLSTVDHCTITNIITLNNTVGIQLYASSYNYISNSSISNNDDGIYLFHLNNYNTLTNNKVSNNYNGIYLYYSGNNDISNNDISNNYWRGIYLVSSSLYNSISNNNISNNFCGIRFCLLYTSPSPRD